MVADFFIMPLQGSLFQNFELWFWTSPEMKISECCPDHGTMLMHILEMTVGQIFLPCKLSVIRHQDHSTIMKPQYRSPVPPKALLHRPIQSFKRFKVLQAVVHYHKLDTGNCWCLRWLLAFPFQTSCCFGIIFLSSNRNKVHENYCMNSTFFHSAFFTWNWSEVSTSVCFLETWIWKAITTFSRRKNTSTAGKLGASGM